MSIYPRDERMMNYWNRHYHGVQIESRRKESSAIDFLLRIVSVLADKNKREVK